MKKSLSHPILVNPGNDGIIAPLSCWSSLPQGLSSTLPFLNRKSHHRPIVYHALNPSGRALKMLEKEWQIKKLSQAFILMIACVLCGTVPLPASQLHLTPIENDATSIKCVIKVKVTKVEHGEDHMKLKDGTQGPKTSAYILISGDVVKVVWGSTTLEKIKTRYTWQSGNVYDADGKVIMTKSLLRSGSGSENDIKEGEEYIFSYDDVPVTTNKETTPILMHMRSDPVSRQDEIVKLLKIAEP